MPTSTQRRKLKPIFNALIEIGFILFLFYANLLMGEFTRSGHAHGHGLLYALHDIFTPENFLIALFTAMLGYGVFEYLRRQV